MSLAEGYTPGGRWERILAVVSDKPVRTNEIARRARDGRYSMNIEKKKVHRALEQMRDLGLVAFRGPGVVATAAGRAALHSSDFVLETEHG